uniref:Hint domain-containing protein n=1 Tax=Erythrolobus madagascarensis TaxID=708628 RepID=A0A7S0T5B9_9RHOD|mmetsp:Transcript_3430/g.7416  ORF Transcript_3430/g.7416 Transcript_3430/m.7416 type:complete len:293 (+) Transcript_3430:161-1039(+)
MAKNLCGVLLVLVAAMAPAGALKFCKYDDAACTLDEICLEYDAGQCDAFEDGSAVLECVDGGLKVIAYEDLGCVGTSTSYTINGSEGECIRTPFGLLFEAIKWKECSGGGDCFASDATVELSDGEFKRMDELDVGDVVRVSPTDFSPVYFWGHKDADSTSSHFVELELESGRTLTLSNNHMVYANDKLVRTRDVVVGDQMIDAVQGASAVTKIRSNMAKRGLFNPHTIHGDIVVDGVLASTYTSTQLSSTAHMLLSVERVAYRLGFSFLGNMLEKHRPSILSWYLRAFPESI